MHEPLPVELARVARQVRATPLRDPTPDSAEPYPGGYAYRVRAHGQVVRAVEAGCHPAWARSSAA
jgi:hypothetical protein